MLPFFETVGEMPLPPYIERSVDLEDHARYQTVYARHPGAVAAPTAGLHFTEALLGELEAAGVGQTTVTLHVGAGTFSPVRGEELTAHRMHEERYVLPPEAVAAIEATRARGGGWSPWVLRWCGFWRPPPGAPGALPPHSGETDIFIYPPSPFAWWMG